MTHAKLGGRLAGRRRAHGMYLDAGRVYPRRTGGSLTTAAAAAVAGEPDGQHPASAQADAAAAAALNATQE